MGLLDRLNLLIRSNLNTRVSQGDDPDAALADALGELEAALRDARRQTARIMKDERRLEARLDELRHDADRWEERAYNALKASSEDTAREALAEKHAVLARAARVEEELDNLRAYLGDLMKSLEALEVKLDAARSRTHDRKRQHARDRFERRRAHDAPPPALPSRDARQRQRPFGSQVDDHMRSWESLAQRHPERRRRAADAPPDPLFAEQRGRAFERVEDSLREFSRIEDRIGRIEADAEAHRQLERPGLDPDDPLFDPHLARLEARFRELEFEDFRDRHRDPDPD